jgi:hypothetical protein
MVNFGLNPASFLGIILAIAGVGLYFLRSFRPELSRDQDIFFAAIGLVCGFILLFQGWRLDPLLQLGQFLIAGTAVYFAYDNIKMRGVATEAAKRNTPVVDRERRVSRQYRAELDERESLDADRSRDRNRRRLNADRRGDDRVDDRRNYRREEESWEENMPRERRRNRRLSGDTPRNKERTYGAVVQDDWNEDEGNEWNEYPREQRALNPANASRRRDEGEPPRNRRRRSSSQVEDLNSPDDSRTDDSVAYEPLGSGDDTPLNLPDRDDRY